MKKILLLSSLLSASAMAADVSYTYLDIGYLDGEANLPDGYSTFLGLDEDLDVEGFFVKGSVEITSNFFAYGRYENGELQADFTGGGGFDVDVWRAEVGIGGYAALADSLDVYFTAGYKYSELDLDAIDLEQDVGNIELNVGLRWSIGGWVELNPYVTQSLGVRDDEFIESVDTSTVGINAYVTGIPYLQPFAGFSYEFAGSDDNIADELKTFTAGVRFSF